MPPFAARLVVGAVTVLALPALAAADNPKLHPVESVCIEYEMAGQMQTGTMLQCHRDHGYQQFQIQSTKIDVGGFKQTNESHIITIGDTIYTIDLKTKTGTRMKNPMYENIASALEGKSPQEMAKTFTDAMGFKPTGESKTVAGKRCATHRSASLGEMCLSDEGLMLEMNVVGSLTRAVSISLGDGGEDANYRLHETVPISDSADLSNLRNLMNPPAGN